MFKTIKSLIHRVKVFNMDTVHEEHVSSENFTLCWSMMKYYLHITPSVNKQSQQISTKPDLSKSNDSVITKKQGDQTQHSFSKKRDSN